MFAGIVREFADRCVDELAPITDAERQSDADSPPRLAVLLEHPSKVGADDGSILAAIVEVARARNVLDAAQAQLVRAAERAGIPFRKRVRTGAGLLMAIGVPPVVAYRTARNGQHAERLDAVARGQRDGSLATEMADAVGRGVELVTRRTPLEFDERNALARRLLLHSTPAEVATAARRESLKLVAEAVDLDAVPVAENVDLNEMTLTVDDEGRVTSSLNLDVLTGEELHAALDPLCRPVPLPDGRPDPRSASQRRADAFGQIVRVYLAGSDRPTSGGVLPHATVVIPTAGAPGDGIAQLGFSGPVSATTVQLALCTSAVAAVYVDGEGVPLDVGREHRLFTPQLRKALAVRDGGCAFPGCGRPVSWTDAHHCIPWAQGGDTALGNGVLLCRMHHVMIHQSGWEVAIGDDGHPWFTEPTNPNQPGRQRIRHRSHARRTLTDYPEAA